MLNPGSIDQRNPVYTEFITILKSILDIPNNRLKIILTSRYDLDIRAGLSSKVGWGRLAILAIWAPVGNTRNCTCVYIIGIRLPTGVLIACINVFLTENELLTVHMYITVVDCMAY